MMQKFCLRSLAFLFLSGMMFLTVAAQEKSVALTPDVQPADWWQKRHEEKVALMKKGDVELLMIGDSITHGWEGAGKEVWDKYYANRKILNDGFSGDRTEHVLWRLQHSPLDAIHPKAITIMIGTNNIGHGSSSPKETAEGIRAIVDLLQKQYPDAKIFVLYVFPRNDTPLRDSMRNDNPDLGAKVREINSYLPEMVGKLKNVTLVDIGYLFLDENGTLPKSIMPDLLHPNAEGYEIWAKAVEPILKPIFDK